MAYRKKTGGRKAGVPNKLTVEIKDMIRNALEASGGQQYLMRQAEENPTAFLTLIGKIIPSDGKLSVTHSGSVAHKHEPVSQTVDWLREFTGADTKGATPQPVHH